mmetsp:Transcript_14205/g.46639  ORF Transcript_14205/g.46639 Transcript_14205/m.46639 type:complete len:502 (+) Transcript_14205:59-1564(+)
MARGPAELAVPASGPASCKDAPPQEMNGTTTAGGEKAHAVGTRVRAFAAFDKNYHVAEIVEYRKTGGRGNAAFEYYVHYVDYNKRVDEWVSGSKIHLNMPSVSLKAISPTSPDGTSPLGSNGRKVTRTMKRRYNEMHNVVTTEELTPNDRLLEKEHEERTKVKNIQMIEMGKYNVDTWYWAPYPDEYGTQEKLFVCEFCLKYMRKRSSCMKHKAKCSVREPPGKEIYRHPHRPGLPALSMYEVDGSDKAAHLYCQNLCLCSKLFLDHKTLFFDVNPFLFYILTEKDDAGNAHVVGYFSKEKASVEQNLACILVLPPFQRRGYGSFLISFAYELSKREARIGTPERPLSDLGQVSFRSYWTRVVLEVLREHEGNISINDIATLTSIRTDDIVYTLQSLNLIKYWKGSRVISASPKMLDELMRTLGVRQPLYADPAGLADWTPPYQTVTQQRTPRVRARPTPMLLEAVAHADDDDDDEDEEDEDEEEDDEKLEMDEEADMEED